MSSLTADRFARLKALQQPLRVRPPLEEDIDQTFRPSVADVRAASDRLSQLLGATPKCNAHGEHLSLHCWFGEHAPITPQPDAVRLLAPEATDDVADSHRWLFLDTETTGLMGGTGTYPFLVGLAWWDGGGLEVEQLFMREYNEERSVLAAIAERLAERPVLVTFNGKSFDWPLLETRFRMARRIALPKPQAHLDFLHPARNLWRLRLGSAKLSHLERHVLAWDRGADLVSNMIPKMYFDYVRWGRPDGLVPVFQHNQMDLRGLAGLADRVLTLLSEEDSGSNDGLELFGASRICERRGHAKRARRLYTRSLAASLPAQTDRLARQALARLAKREGDLESACNVWRSALGNSREGYDAYEQLAIHFEHRERDPGKALEIVGLALAELRRANSDGMIGPNFFRQREAQFLHRLQRLESKTSRMFGHGVTTRIQADLRLTRDGSD